MGLQDNKMSPEAIASDKTKGTLIPVKGIYVDHEFNCRGQFSAASCNSLAEDIAKRGLLQPVTLREVRTEDKVIYGSEYKNEQHLIRRGITHIALAGHRRITAYKINNAEYIPAFIKEAYITDFEAHDINAIENLQRENLNIWQEAMSIRHYYQAAWGGHDAAKKLGVSYGWLQPRWALLGMDPQIQELAAQGHLLAIDITELNKEKDPLKRLAAAGYIRDKRKQGFRNVAKDIKQPDKKSTKKQRGRDDIFDLQSYIQEQFADADSEKMANVGKIVTPSGNNILTRVLGWAAGEVTTYEVHVSLKDFAEIVGVDYSVPVLED